MSEPHGTLYHEPADVAVVCIDFVAWLAGFSLCAGRKSGGSAHVFQLSAMLSEGSARLSEGSARLSEHSARLSEASARLSERSARLSEASARLSEDSARLSEASARLSERSARLSERSARLSEVSARIAVGITRFLSGRAFRKGDFSPWFVSPPKVYTQVFYIFIVPWSLKTHAYIGYLIR